MSQALALPLAKLKTPNQTKTKPPQKTIKPNKKPSCNNSHV